MVERIIILLVEVNEADARWMEELVQDIPSLNTHFFHVDSLEKMRSWMVDHTADMILLALGFQNSKSMSSIRDVVKIAKDALVIVLSSAADVEITTKAIRNGAHGFLTKNGMTSEKLAITLHCALERQKNRKKSIKSQRQLSTLISNLPGMMYRCRNDENWTMEYLSDACEELTGYTVDDILLDKKISFNDIIHPGDRGRVWAEVQKAVEQNTHYMLEYRIITASGEEKWVSEQGKAFTMLDSGETHLEGFIFDITDKHVREMEMRALVELGDIVQAAHSNEELTKNILDKFSALFSAKCALVGVPTGRPAYLKIDIAVGEWARLQGETIDISDSVIQDALIKKKRIIIDQKEDLIRFSKVLECFQGEFAVAIPLIIQKQVVGVGVMGRQGSLSEHELRLIDNISSLVATAVETMNMKRKAHQHLKRLEALHAIDLAISGVFDIRVINRIILNEVRKGLDVDAADILMLNRVTNTLDFAGDFGFKNTLVKKAKIPLNNSFAGEALISRKSLHIPDLSQVKIKFIDRAFETEKFKAYFASPLIVKGEAQGVLEVFFREPFYPDLDWLKFLDALSTHTAVAFESYRTIRSLQQSQQKLARSYDTALKSWSKSLELLEPDHQEQINWVKKYTLALAKQFGFAEDELVNIGRGVLLHDLGKIGVVSEILNKKEELSSQEWVEIKKHPEIAWKLLAGVDILKDAVDIPYCHHENWDGSGYPRGLKGEGIPMGARIFAVVESYDAMISDRPYRKAWTKEKALAYIQEQAGKKFDPQVVKAFVAMG